MPSSGPYDLQEPRQSGTDAWHAGVERLVSVDQTKVVC